MLHWGRVALTLHPPSLDLSDSSLSPSVLDLCLASGPVVAVHVGVEGRQTWGELPAAVGLGG